MNTKVINIIDKCKFTIYYCVYYSCILQYTSVIESKVYIRKFSLNKHYYHFNIIL